MNVCSGPARAGMEGDNAAPSQRGGTATLETAQNVTPRPPRGKAGEAAKVFSSTRRHLPEGTGGNST